MRSNDTGTIPTIGIFFDEEEPVGYPFNHLHYRKAYESLVERISRYGGKGVILRGERTYRGKGQFSSHSTFNSDRHIVESGPVKVDLLFHRPRKRTTIFDRDTTFCLLNPATVFDMCHDKAVCAEMFRDLHPTTLRVQSGKDLAQAIDSLHTADRYVVKSTVGMGGDNVTIGSRSELLRSEHQFPVVVQRFVDSSAGYPGIVSTVHDLRINILGGKIVAAYVRQPKLGELKSNLHQGGTLTMVALSKLPPELTNKAAEITRRTPAIEKSFFSADFVFGEGRWYLIELNDRPGLVEESQHGLLAGDFLDQLAKYLVRLAEK